MYPIPSIKDVYFHTNFNNAKLQQLGLSALRIPTKICTDLSCTFGVVFFLKALPVSSSLCLFKYSLANYKGNEVSHHALFYAYSTAMLGMKRNLSETSDN
jgi:hypothetical protein